MRSVLLAFGLAVGVGAAVPVHAVTLSSALLSAGGGAGGGTLLCTVSNLDKKPVAVTMTMLSQTGSVFEDSDTCAQLFAGLLPPGQSCTGSVAGGQAARCTVVASSNKVRAVFYVRDSAFNATAALPLTK